MNLISPSVLRVFTAILALSAVVILACAQDPTPSPTPAPTASLEPTAAPPTASPPPNDGYTSYDPNGNPTADFQGDRQLSVGHGGHEADDGFGSDYHP